MTANSVDDLIHRKQDAIACPYPIFADLRAAEGVPYNADLGDRKSTRLNSSHVSESRMPSSA